MVKFNIPFLFLLTGVWLILLGLCALIGILIVPVDPTINSEILKFLLSAGKVFISLLVIMVWLYGWYKAMDLILKVEFYLADTSEETRTPIVPKDD